MLDNIDEYFYSLLINIIGGVFSFFKVKKK